MRFKRRRSTILTAQATSTRVTFLLILFVLPVLPFVVSTPVLPDNLGLDLRLCLMNHDGVALDILAIHFLSRLEEIVRIAKADEAVSFTLGCALISDHLGSLDTAPAREGLEKGFVRCLARQVTNE